MSILRVQDLHKSYGKDGERRPVINGVSFELQRGECYGLLGPNGAGKTTTLKLCLGLTAPDSGHITLVGHDIPAEARQARARIGVVPQMDSLDPDFSVEENLIVYGRYFGMARADIVARLDWLLEFSNLSAKRHAYINELSGGMKRRLTLARALVNDPDIIFMDEPTTGLDPQARHMIWERLKMLLAEGKTILLTTHFMDEAERLCDRLAVIDHGRLIAEGAPRELIAEHIESQVVEVYGDGAIDWAARLKARASASPAAPDHALTPSPAERIEISGETVFCYTHRAEPLLQDLGTANGLRYLHRPANLEDLFLKLTGREMRD